jgi:cytochrome c553
VNRRRTIVAAVAVLALGGFLVAAAGLVPIGASSRHWPFTSWFLHFTMRQSVQARALGIDPPPLDDHVLVLRGAGHYASGCAPCHGAPGDPRAEPVQHMTPHPPDLVPRIARWETAELYWIVKHGVKFTGMPGWPAQQRNDEVWAMVAFLLRLPDLNADEYHRLAYGEEAPGSTAGEEIGLSTLNEPFREELERCERCHGPDGRGRGNGAFPKLAGQSGAYLYAALRAYAMGTRSSGFMEGAVTALTDDMMRRLAEHYAERSAGPNLPVEGFDAAARRRGQQIAEYGVPTLRLPACVFCHGPGSAPRNPFYPSLAGQYADYLGLQLTLLRGGQRGGSAYAHVMQMIAKRLTDGQIRDVAEYYASLDPERRGVSAELGLGSAGR